MLLHVINYTMGLINNYSNNSLIVQILETSIPLQLADNIAN